MRPLVSLGLASLVGAGCQLGGDSTFERADEEVGLQVESVSPTDGATTVDLFSSVSVTFAEPVDPMTVATNDLAVVGIGGSIATSGNTITFFPTDELPYATLLEASVADVSSIGGSSMAQPHEWSFSTRDYAWQSAAPLPPSPSGLPQVAVGANGAIFLAWLDTAGNAWGAVSLDGATWDTDLLENGGGAVATLVRIAADELGNAIAVWPQSNGTRQSIWANRYTASIGWGTAEEIDSGTVGSFFPDIACQPDGRGVAVWSQQSNGTQSVWSSSYAPATGWSAPGLLETSDSGPTGLFGPDVACSAGGCMAVWAQSDGVSWSVFANRRLGQTWLGAAVVSGDDPIEGGVQYGPFVSVAVDDTGNAIAIWQRKSTTEVWANVFRVVGGWQTAGAISSTGASAPTVTLDPTGSRAIALWKNFDGALDDLLASSWTLTSGWEAPLAVTVENENVTSGNRMLLDDRGNGVAVWRQFDGTRNNLWARRFLDGNWGAAQVIELDDSDVTSISSPGMGTDGKAFVLWTQGGSIQLNAFR